jgi:hypothetical protein
MKKLLSFAMLVFLMSSCAPKVERFVSYFDYTPVTEAYGVHFTESDVVSFDYETLGSLCVFETSGVVRIEYTDPKETMPFMVQQKQLEKNIKKLPVNLCFNFLLRKQKRLEVVIS